MELTTFENLLPHLQAADQQQEQCRKACVVRTGQPRKRRPGGGGHYANDLADRCLMLLLSYRLYVTQEFLTLLFRAENKSVICRSIQAVRPVWEAVLPVPERLRQRMLTAAREVNQRRQRRIGSLAEFRDAYPELDFLIDGVEQPKRKPKKPQARKDDYSGKKRCPTRKQLLTTTRSGLIVDQSPSVGGRAHDFAVFKDDHARRGRVNDLAEVRATLYADSGFQGMQEMGLPVAVRVIERGRRNHPLTRQQREINRLCASIRIRVEHTISRRRSTAIGMATTTGR